MGVKSATQNKNKQSQGYKVNGLRFPSIETVCKLMTIDYNFESIVENASSDTKNKSNRNISRCL